MSKTIWEAAVEEGIKVGEEREAIRSRQQTLLRQLRKKFNKVPVKLVKRIEAMKRVEQLDAWLVEVVTADNLTDMSLAKTE